MWKKTEFFDVARVTLSTLAGTGLFVLVTVALLAPVIDVVLRTI